MIKKKFLAPKIFADLISLFKHEKSCVLGKQNDPDRVNVTDDAMTKAQAANQPVIC